MRDIINCLAQLEIWAVTFAVAISFAWPNLLPAAVLTAAFFWLVRWLASGYTGKRRLTVSTPADLPMLLLLVMLLVTLWITPFPTRTLEQVYRILSGIGLYYAIINGCSSVSQLRWLRAGVALAGTGLALFALISVEWAAKFIPLPVQEYFVLLVSNTVHPNVMAGSIILLLIPILAALLFEWKNLHRSERFFFGGSVFMMSIILVLTQSRGAIVACGIAVLFLLTLRWRWGWIGWGFAGMALSGLIYKYGLQELLHKFFSTSIILGMDGRNAIWRRAVLLISDYPFTGIGMGSFGEVANTLYPFARNPDTIIPHTHNLMLQITVDLGVPGLVAWVVILAGVCLTCWKLYRSGQKLGNPFISSLGVGLLCSQLAMLLHGMSDNVVWGMMRSGPIVWALWGIAITAANLHLEKNQ